MVRYKLRTLMIVLALGPPLLAGTWLWPVYSGLVAAFLLYVVVTISALGVIKYAPRAIPQDGE